MCQYTEHVGNTREANKQKDTDDVQQHIQRNKHQRYRPAKLVRKILYWDTKKEED